MKKLVVFDMDGTILDSHSYFCGIIAEYSQSQGLPLPCLATIQNGYADPLNHDYKWGVPREEQARHLNAVWDIATRREGRDGQAPPLFRGVEEALTTLHGVGHTMAVVTAKSEEPLLRLFDYHDIGRFFAAHRNADDVKRGRGRIKPAPDLLECVMRELDFAPEQTVMIGDTTMDIQMGLAARATTIGVSWGNHDRAKLSSAGAHHLVDTDFGDVTRVIASLGARA